MPFGTTRGKLPVGGHLSFIYAIPFENKNFNKYPLDYTVNLISIKQFSVLLGILSKSMLMGVAIDLCGRNGFETYRLNKKLTHFKITERFFTISQNLYKDLIFLFWDKNTYVFVSFFYVLSILPIVICLTIELALFTLNYAERQEHAFWKEALYYFFSALLKEIISKTVFSDLNTLTRYTFIEAPFGDKQYFLIYL